MRNVKISAREQSIYYGSREDWKINVQKKIADDNDLSGYGRCSLTVAIPVLSAMGHSVLSGADGPILSSHTEFPVVFL